MRAARFMVVDDQPIYSAGLKSFLSSIYPGSEVVEVGSMDDAVTCARQLGPRFDLIFFDWQLQSGGGVRGLRTLRERAPQVPVTVVSNSGEDAVRLAAQAVGATGVLPRKVGMDAVRRHVAEILPHRPPAEAAEDPAPAPQWNEPEPLTARQRDVLRLMARGFANKKIARMLGIADTTVRQHVSCILRQLRADNRTDAVLRAARRGLISGPGMN